MPTRKKFEASNYSPKKKKNLTHEIPTRKNFGPAKYPPEKN